ncbi:MAG: DNA-binding response regulator, partial [Spirochaetia bacterium]|nr:DNA-binding response regulator [Spirochaetia bacterium]
MEVAEKKIKVLIADDHEIFLLGLGYLLKQNQKFDLVGKILEPNEILTMIEFKKPDLLIIDFLMPGTNGMDIIVKAK